MNVNELRNHVGDAACYADDCLFVSDSRLSLCRAEAVRLDLLLMVFCTAGCVRWEQNGQVCTLFEHDLGIVLYGTSMHKVSFSDDCRVKVVGLEGRFLQRLLRTGTDVWQLAHYVRSNPVKHLDGRNFELMLRYVDLIGTELAVGDTVRREEIMQHLFSALVLGMMSDINRSMMSLSTAEKEKVSPSMYTFRRFMEEVYADNGHHRSVTYYADRLCCSPPYLSRLVKRVSGRKALALINECAVERIAFELKHSDKTIKEISIEYDFPNVSFFTKYVRKHLKVAPSVFRSKGKSGKGS